MKLLTEHDFSLKIVSESTQTETARSILSIEGKNSTAFIDGEYCEACIKHQEFYLILTTNNCPYEESLNIHYLSGSLDLLDKATLVMPYNTGTFSLVELTEPNKIQFSFFNDAKWTIELFTHRKIFLSAFSEPRGVWRKFGLTHYFLISDQAKLKN